MDPKERDRLQAMLLARRRGLIDALERLRGDEDEQEAIGGQGPAGEAEAGQRIAATGHVEEQLTQVDAAIERLEQGIYGYCTRCGEAIAAERLAELPETEYCPRCSAELDLRADRIAREPEGAPRTRPATRP